MANPVLVVEDGSGVAGANSYCSVANADSYASNRNDAIWLALDAVVVKPAALISATQYMQQAFRMRWQGWRHLDTQVLDWPRFAVPKPDSPSGYGIFPNYYDFASIPQEIKDAQCMLASKISGSGALAPDLARVTSSEAVGSLKVTYDTNSPPFTIYRDVEMLLASFFKSSGMNVMVGRS